MGVWVLRWLNIAFLWIVLVVTIHYRHNILGYLNQKLHSCFLCLPFVDEKVWHNRQELSEVALTELLSSRALNHLDHLIQ